MGNARIELGAKGTGLRILTETVTSPTLGAQIKSCSHSFRKPNGTSMKSCGGDSVREGARLAFGRPVNPVYHFDQADVVVSLDADFLDSRRRARALCARFFVAARSGRRAGIENNRLYVVESMPTSTGAMADHRLPLRSSDVEVFARQLRQPWACPCRQRERAAAKIPADWVEAVGRIWRRIAVLSDRGRRRTTTAVRSRAGARHERGARQCGQDGDLHRSIEANPVTRWNRCAIW